MLRSGLIIAAVTAGMTATISFAASAQTLCSARSNFLKHLGASHAEAPSAMGLTSSGKVVEILTSEKGTWTIIVTNPDGVSCVVAAGDAWENVERIALHEPGA
jgi:hypothetical protein